MKQYSFRVVNKKRGNADQVLCTAARPEWARLQVLTYYGDNYEIGAEPEAVYPPHRVYGEIDASDMTERDAEWLEKRIAREHA